MTDDEMKPLKIFEENSNVEQAMKKLRASPYGKAIIGAQIQQEIRRRLGIPLEALKDVTAQVRFHGLTETGEDLYMIWSDGVHSSKTEKEIEDVVDVIEKELTAMGYPECHFYMTYIPKDGSEPK